MITPEAKIKHDEIVELLEADENVHSVLLADSMSTGRPFTTITFKCGVSVEVTRSLAKELGGGSTNRGMNSHQVFVWHN